MPKISLCLPAILSATAALAQNTTVAGEVTTPYPTVTNLAIDWKIQGDDNLNGVVTVKFRRAGESAWHDAMPLRRVPAGSSRTTRPVFHWENRHSGSIFDLRPDTEYEISLSLSDPDGGSAEKTFRARTRPVPHDPPHPRRKKANPQTLASVAGSAQPGDVILL